jgi:hypothetical protein
MNEATEDEVHPLILRPNRISARVDTRTALQKNLAVCLILISAGLERLAFYSLAGNLTFFLDSKIIRWNFPHTIIGPLIFLGNKTKESNKIYFIKFPIF